MLQYSLNTNNQNEEKKKQHLCLIQNNDRVVRFEGKGNGYNVEILP